MRVLRAGVDAVIIGAGNLRTDDPDLGLLAEEHARRRALGLPEPLRVVVTSTGAGLDAGRKMFNPARGGPAIVAHTADLGTTERARLATFALLRIVGA